MRFLSALTLLFFVACGQSKPEKTFVIKEKYDNGNPRFAHVYLGTDTTELISVIEYYENGHKRSEIFSHPYPGNSNILKVYWYESGKLSDSLTFNKKDDLVRKRSWHENGILSEIYNITGEDSVVVYDSLGNWKTSYHYLVGEIFSYYENGKPSYELRSINDTSFERNWNTKGELVSEVFRAHGTIKYDSLDNPTKK